MEALFTLVACMTLALSIPPQSSLQEGPQPRVYEAVRTSGPIDTDGELSEGAWADAPWSQDFVDIRDTKPATGQEGQAQGYPPPPLRTQVKILWDEEFLYIGAEMEEPHLWATLLERDAIIYRDDDFEVFLDPDGDGLEYFELEINALGTEFDLFLDRPYNQGGSADIDWDISGLKTGMSLHGSLNDPSDQDRGWSVEMAIPWSGLVPPISHRSQTGAQATPDRQEGTFLPSRHGTPPNPGDRWRVNFSRVDWPLEVVGGRYQKAEEPTSDNPHPESNWVWSPQGVINMHLPQMWGVVEFVGRRLEAMPGAEAPRDGPGPRSPGPGPVPPPHP